MMTGLGWQFLAMERCVRLLQDGFYYAYPHSDSHPACTPLCRIASSPKEEIHYSSSEHSKILTVNKTRAESSINCRVV